MRKLRARSLQLVVAPSIFAVFLEQHQGDCAIVIRTERSHLPIVDELMHSCVRDGNRTMDERIIVPNYRALRTQPKGCACRRLERGP